jgi:hypothetical protein
VVYHHNIVVQNNRRTIVVYTSWNSWACIYFVVGIETGKVVVAVVAVVVETAVV